MAGDQKNSVALIFLIILLLIVNLLASCSGCSKSGRKIPPDNDTIYYRSSEGWEQRARDSSGLRAQGSGKKADSLLRQGYGD
jgi:hypothetical protein